MSRYARWYALRTAHHRGSSAARLIERAALTRMHTLIVNGYWGARLGGGELTAHEKTETELLREWFINEGRVVKLTQVYPAV